DSWVDDGIQVNYEIETPTPDQELEFTITCRVTRQPWVMGELEVYPSTRVTIWNFEREMLPAPVTDSIEVGDFIVDSDPSVLWDYRYEENYAVIYEGDVRLNEGKLGLLEYHMEYVSHNTAYLGAEPRELYYMLHTQVETEEGLLENTELEYNNIKDWTEYTEIEPYPDEIGTDYVRWILGDLENNRRWVFWNDEGRTYQESQGFEVTRTIDNTVIPDGFHSIDQTITFDINHYLPENEIRAGVEYDDEYVSIELINGNYLDDADTWDTGLEWRLEPGHNPHEVFWVTYRVTREPGIAGDLEVYPKCRTDSRLRTDFTGDPSIGVEIGDVVLSTSNAVVWEIEKESSNTVWWRDHYEVSVNDFEPPLVTITSPSNHGIYQAGSDDKIQFTVTDDIDPEPTIDAYIYDAEYNAYRIQNGDHLPIISGDYRLIVEARDEAGNIGTDETQFIVFDPEAGFVTGGGWINQNQKANFGFVSKYKKNSLIPEGNFNFKTKDLDVKATEIEWMTVSEDTAVFQGQCTVHKQGSYTYRVTVFDGDIVGDQSDSFYLRIWDSQDTETDPVYIYSGDLLGGNIVVHSQLEYFDIGVTSSSDPGNDVTYILADMAKQDVNQYCIEENLPYRFNYVVKENHGNAGTALQNTIDFHEAGINLIAGHGWSSQCQASLDYVNNNDMLLFSSSSTTPTLAIDDNLYRLTTNDLVSGQVIADFLELMNVQGIAILYTGDIWGSGLNQVVVSECQEKGISILSSVAYDTNDGDYSAELAQIETSITESGYTGFEVGVLVISFNEATDILRCVEDNYPALLDVTWYGGDGTALNYDILDAEPELVTTVKLYSTLVSPIYDDTLYQSFASRLESVGRVPSFYNAAKYDIMILYAKAVINAGTSDTELVRTALENLVVDYHGASGYSTFDCNGDRMGADYDIWGYDIVDGEPSIIKYGHYYLETDQITIYP
ncbi:ABC transporter substrate-binding protein, partial [archaeon]|nr:ABC transporter substrate-binding protein [archaeon]